jgi:hypothetical protein
MLEEALMGLPSRPEPPCEGERRAWAARLSRVPDLVGNAPGFLKKPGGVQLEEAAARLDVLISRRAELNISARERYGETVPELEAAMDAVRAYRGLLGPFLGARTSSRQIMGLEELSNILRYSEHLDFDPGKMIDEAEKTMRRLSRQIVPSAVSVRYPETSMITVTAGLADSLLASIEEGLSSKSSFGGLKRARPAVVAYGKMWEPLRVPVNPYLTLPAFPERDVRWHISPCGGRGCEPSVLVPDGEPMTLDRLQFDLLMSSSLISSPFRKMCAEGSRVRRVFCSDTYRYAWSEHNSGDLTALFPGQRMLLSRIETRERIGALARLILVFRLNSGKFTTESAADYLRELVPLGEDWIDNEVRLAALSPGAAFEGIAYLTVESMLKKAVVDRAGGRPRDRVRKLLFESAGMPPYFVLMRMP